MVIALVMLIAGAVPAAARPLRELFQKISPAVVVVKTVGKEISYNFV